MDQKFRIEVCANSLESSIEAEKGGACRVELCAGIPEGGTTPSYGEIATARETMKIQLNVIIRPRGGDFLYSPLEHRIMLKDIEACRKLNVDGVVIGALNADGDIDMKRCRELIEAAGEMDITFHRAFDMCRDPFESLERVIELGCKRILTSGGKPRAEQGVKLIKELAEQSAGRLSIMPGSGINENNIREIAEATGAKEFHLSLRTSVESGMRYRNPRINMAGSSLPTDEYIKQVTSAKRVAKAIQRLNQGTIN